MMFGVLMARKSVLILSSFMALILVGFSTEAFGALTSSDQVKPSHLMPALTGKPSSPNFRFTNRVEIISPQTWVGATLEQKASDGRWSVADKISGAVSQYVYKNGKWRFLHVCYKVPPDWAGILIETSPFWACGTVPNRPGLKLRMVYKNASWTTGIDSAQRITVKRIIASAESDCLFMARLEMTNDNDWLWGKIKIVLQYRPSRFAKWKNDDFSYQIETLQHSSPAKLYRTDCSSSGWYRLVVPGTKVTLPLGHF